MYVSTVHRLKDSRSIDIDDILEVIWRNITPDPSRTPSKVYRDSSDPAPSFAFAGFGTHIVRVMTRRVSDGISTHYRDMAAPYGPSVVSLSLIGRGTRRKGPVLPLEYYWAGIL